MDGQVGQAAANYYPEQPSLSLRLLPKSAGRGSSGATKAAVAPSAPLWSRETLHHFSAVDASGILIKVINFF